VKYASVTDRLADLGGEKWEIHNLARALISAGQDVIELTIGEPDVATPPDLIQIAAAAMASGRTGYSDGRGEANLRAALAARYSKTTGRTFTADQTLCFPGTQTSLYAVFMGLTEAGDEVLVGDPMYATYEGVIAASGAKAVPVPLRPENGFRISAADIASRITASSRVIFLNTPHNPTGAILSAKDLAEIATLAISHDLWIVSDEVYEELVFDGAEFVSPLSLPEIADRVIAVSSVSKSHAAPGFRSGWCVGPAEFTKRLLPLAETMLFGNQPFIADMTAHAVSAPSEVAAGMRERFARRAGLVFDLLDGVAGLRVSRPCAGMFALIDISATGLSGRDYALDLLHNAGVAVMPGASFGANLAGWVRMALTTEDEILAEACARIASRAATTNQARCAG
jgi:arginine:pyruvate transaminase